MSFCAAASCLLCSAFPPSPFTALAADSPNAHPPANPKVRAILADLGKVQNVGETSLSPDGKHLAWTEGGHGHGSPSRIMVSDARGEGAQQMDMGKDCTASDPQWSPDSRALLFEGDCGKDGQTDLFVTTLDGKPQPDHPPEGLCGARGMVAGLAAHRLSVCARAPPGRQARSRR